MTAPSLDTSEVRFVAGKTDIFAKGSYRIYSAVDNNIHLNINVYRI